MTSQDKFIAWAEKNMPTLHLERSEVSGHFVSPVTGNIFIGWSARNGEVEALQKDAERWQCVRNAIPMQSPYAVWREGSHLVLGKDADDLVDNFLSKSKEVGHD